MNTGLHIHVGVEETTFSYKNLYKEAMKDIRALQNSYKLNSLNVVSAVSAILGMPADGIETVEEYINKFTELVNAKVGLKLFWITVAGRDKEAKEIEELTERYLTDVRRIVLG